MLNVFLPLQSVILVYCWSFLGYESAKLLSLRVTLPAAVANALFPILQHAPSPAPITAHEEKLLTNTSAVREKVTQSQRRMRKLTNPSAGQETLNQS